MIKIDGIVPIIPVPFNEDESINFSDLKRLVEFCATSGASAVCLPAYASEFYKLSENERELVVGVAVEAAAKKIPVIGQANHVSSRIACEMAKRYQELGVDIISTAVPRLFPLNDRDILNHLGRIADSISLPFLVQDFNPGGPTIGAQFIQNLNVNHPNFAYTKLEEPLFVNKLIEIRELVGDQVGVLEGWAGYYMLELIPHGLCGVMPGAPLLEPLNHIFRLAKAGEMENAMTQMGQLLPFINYTLQNLELLLQVEKRLLARLGIIEHSTVRASTYTPSEAEFAYSDLLIEHVLKVLPGIMKL